MANDLKLRLDLLFRKGGVKISKRIVDSITVTGESGEKSVQSIGTAVETITGPDDAGTVGYVLIRNMDTSNYILIGTQLETIAYTGQTADFTVGLKVTGGTGGATGWIVYDTDAGTTGTLVLSDVQGTFESETLEDSGTGSATIAGASSAGGTAYSMKLLAGEFALFRATGKDTIRAVANTAAVSIEKIIIEL